jgi:hypothetical protein
MLKVLIAVDVEIWPLSRDPGPEGFRNDFRRFIFGPTEHGDFGLPYQLKLLKRHGLKGIFLVDALFAAVHGMEYLREVVDLIRGEDQEVQLHLHTEWVDRVDDLLPGRGGRHIRDFTQDEQALLIRHGIESLEACGVEKVIAFRAGNFGANFDTLRALAGNGILFDTSYNYPYLDSACSLRMEEAVMQPRRLEGVFEFPVQFYHQGFGKPNHVQFGACSCGELTALLEQAAGMGWYAFQVLSHSFEFLDARRRGPDRIVARRFERFLEYLEAHRDRFETCWFSDLDPGRIPVDIRTGPLRSNPFRTAWRYGEQLMRRLIS